MEIIAFYGLTIAHSNCSVLYSFTANHFGTVNSAVHQVGSSPKRALRRKESASSVRSRLSVDHITRGRSRSMDDSARLA